MSEFELNQVEARVLGALMEKEVTTPEYYPLTLNALVAACNQKSNRDPVVNYAEADVAAALHDLRAKGLVLELSGVSHRVPKYSQRFAEKFSLGRREHAIVCELLIRGPQTLGELRTHAERMHAFADLEEVESCLTRLMEWPGRQMVLRLPRQAGRKEQRFAHLLAGEPIGLEADGEPTASITAAPAPVSSYAQEIAELREQVRRQGDEIAALGHALRQLKEQLGA